MNNLIDKFTLECRTNKSGKLKRFKLNYVSEETYKFWKADSNVMMRDALLANKIGISYPRQLETNNNSKYLDIMIENIRDTYKIYVSFYNYRNSNNII